MTDRSIIALVATNAMGVAIFLATGSCFWIEPELADVPGANAGNMSGWILVAAPILVFFVVGNLIWAALTAARAKRTDRVRYTGLHVVMLAGWAAAYLFDNVHHGI